MPILNPNIRDRILYMNVESQKSQGRQTNVIPTTGSHEVVFVSGKIMYIMRQPPPPAMVRNRNHEITHMNARPALGSRTGI
uniref:Uncharacterized protein n=1 Tax=Cannabis sativa TaxID=3483 RepID=A0A803PIN9_CANSA